MKSGSFFKKKIKWSDILFGVFIVLLVIPATRKPIQVGVNKLKLLVWSPSIDKETDTNIPAFDYILKDVSGTKSVKIVGNGQITFLSFWATWCPPCIAELPSIEALYKDYKGKVNFILVTNENPDVVKQFLEKRNSDLPVFFPVSNVPEQLQSSSLPTNYLIDANGNVLISEKGAADWNSKKVRDLLDELIK